MKRFKDEKGITLIALVITIVVLLILAGVTISMITGHDSAPQKAANAKSEKDIAEAKETAELLINGYIQDHYNDYYVQEVDEDPEDIVMYINKKFIPAGSANAEFKTNGNYKTKVENGNITVTDIEMVTLATGIVDEHGDIIWDEIISDNTTPEEQNTSSTPQGNELANGVVKTEETDKEIVVSVNTFESLIPSVNNNVTVLPSSKNMKITKGTGEKQQQVIVPAGFKLAEDSGRTIEEGIVIEDASKDENGNDTLKTGNQFVWVPVEQVVEYSNTYNNSFLKETLGEVPTEGKIRLARYYFGISTEPELTRKSGSEAIADRYTETAENSAARDIEDFKTKTIAAKGYYIGRYEMGQHSDDYYTTPVCKSGKTVYGNIICSDAVSKSQSLYGIVKKDSIDLYTSDLVNSFAWDTAVTFIEKCGNNSEYAFKSTSGGSGLTGSSSDEQCKINDLGSNVSEWRTEYYYAYNKYGDYGSCVVGGGGTTVSRGHSEWSVKSAGGFRPILYIL